ncbi:MAG: HlyC/CorC family transporter [Armatimonadetes bacterium]|nr:HlyC/CorC family transporter [Armatimonadota bacterium]
MPSDPDPYSPVASLVLIAMLLGLSGMFAASEIGLLTLGKLRARHLADAGSRTARVALHLLENPGRVLSTILIGITTLLYTSETVTTVTCLDLGWGLWIPMFLMPLVVVTLAEVTPVLYASQNPERVALLTAPVIRLVSLLLFPIVFVITGVTDFLVKIVGGMPRPDEPTMTEEEIKTAIDVAEEEGLIQPEERQMLHGVLEFSDKTVREVMVPRVEIVSVASDATLGEAMEMIVREKHSRIPVYRETIDEIMGVIYSKDLLPHLRRGEREIPVEKVCRPPYFIPETKPVNSLLEELQRNHRLMAIVVGKDGGTAGLVTVEDLLEEIVGDILDEYDVAERELEQLSENEWLVDGRLTIRRTNWLLGIRLPEEQYETLAGLVLEQTKKMPSVGQSVTIGDVDITVAAMAGQRIEKVKIVGRCKGKLALEEKELAAD